MGESPGAALLVQRKRTCLESRLCLRVKVGQLAHVVSSCTRRMRVRPGSINQRTLLTGSKMSVSSIHSMALQLVHPERFFGLRTAEQTGVALIAILKSGFMRLRSSTLIEVSRSEPAD